MEYRKEDIALSIEILTSDGGLAPLVHRYLSRLELPPMQLGLVDSGSVELCDLDPQFHVDTTTRYRVDGTNPVFCDLVEQFGVEVTPGGRDWQRRRDGQFVCATTMERMVMVTGSAPLAKSWIVREEIVGMTMAASSMMIVTAQGAKGAVQLNK
ncbi:hypothetical protein EV421DRAFT_1738039 [Armillaria borealis]|uniref:Uncharacterized protein n=1 Tax=Armillaria borealis TaxID=47425 RepID=A0AA39JBY7_9AGAR|nr:hypothetical protein EV421DRAFT_1738039 [Armillaria borealis]